MANPLKPKVIKCLEKEYGAFVINVTSASKSGTMDLVACIEGLFYGLEIKWADDKPSALQKQKINKCLDSGGRAYFIRSVAQLRNILDNDIPPYRYPPNTNLVL